MPDPSAISADQMRHVLDVSRLLVVTADLDMLLRRIAEAATSLLCAERASIFLHDDARKQLWTKIALGAGEIRVPDSAGIVGHVFHANQLLNIPDAYADTRFNREVDRTTGFVTRNLLTIPLPDVDHKPIGVLQVVNKVGGTFLSNDEAMIELLAGQAGVAIQRYNLQKSAIQSAELRHEMQLARKVQDRLIPQKSPGVDGLDAVGWTLPASIAGGDCFDLWKMSDGKLGIFIGDASGHGLAPAMIVSQARTLIRALSEIDCDPMWLLTRVNARLGSDMEDSRFVTAFVGCMTPEGHVTWFSAGHGPVFVRQSLDAPLEMHNPQAPPLGVDIDMANDELPAAIQLAPGGQLIILSDGIFESPHPDRREQFGIERVVELFDRCRSDSPAAILACLRETMVQWQGREEPVDDQTVVIIRRNA
jgi:sigma-B regulation protein RsbU (phosphoserine phosphatase)